METQFLYFAVFDPPHRGHLDRIEAVRNRWAPSTTLLVPLDFYDGEVPGRRIVRTRLVAALAHAVDAVFSDAGLAVWDLQALVARVAARAQRTLVLFDPELPKGLTADRIDAGRAGVELVSEEVLELAPGLPRHTALQRSIRLDDGDWRAKVVAGVEPMVEAFGLYGWGTTSAR